MSIYLYSIVRMHAEFDDKIELLDDLTEFKVSLPVFELRPIKALHVDCTPSETE